MTIAIQPMFEAGQGYATRVCSLLVHVFLHHVSIISQPKNISYIPGILIHLVVTTSKAFQCFLKTLTTGVHPVFI